MPTKSQTDEELMTEYQNGSDEAFRILYERHSGKIYGYLKSRTRSDQITSDFTQEVFIKIHKSKHLYNRSLPVLPWFFSITSSVMIDGLRKLGRNKEVLDVDLDQFASEAETTRETSEALTPLLKNLPDSQQLALQMRYVDEKTFEEIALRLNTSTVNVRQIVSRGIKQLKMILKGEKQNEE